MPLILHVGCVPREADLKRDDEMTRRGKKASVSDPLAEVELKPEAVLGTLISSPEASRAVLQQLLQAVQPKSPTTGPNLKYAFEYLKIGSELMDIFSNCTPTSFSKAACRGAPPFGGVYFLFRKETLIYVGRTENLRRRLGQHLGGKSSFAQEFIKRFRPTVHKEFLEEHIGLVYRELEDLSFQRAVEHVAIGVFQPIFNRE